MRRKGRENGCGGNCHDLNFYCGCFPSPFFPHPDDQFENLVVWDPFGVLEMAKN